MLTRKNIILLIGIITFCLIFAITISANASTLDKIIEKGKLVVGMDPTNPPWNFKDKDTGKITGMATELAHMYAKQLGVELEIKSFAWAGIIPALITNEVDMLATCLSRTVPRSAKIAFTEPYVKAPGIVVAKKGVFNSLSELDSEKVRLNTTTGSVHVELIEKLFPKAQLQLVPTASESASAIIAERSDATLTGILVGLAMVKNNPEKLEILPGYTMMDSFAFAVRYDSPKLLESFNLFMKLIKLNGEYGKLYEEWIEKEWSPDPIENSL